MSHDNPDANTVVEKIEEDGLDAMNAFDTIDELDVEVEAVEVESNTGGSVTFFCLAKIPFAGFESLVIVVIFF